MKVLAAAEPDADPPELVFRWERRPRAHWQLAAIIAGSLLLHAASFYVLQVSYTPTGAQLPPPAQVVMIPPEGPDHEAFARWLAMADPSLTVQPMPPSAAEILAALNFRYVPSFETSRAGFKPLDGATGNATAALPPRPHPPGPVPMPTKGDAARAVSASLATTARGTRVLIDTASSSRLVAPLPPVDFTAPLAGRKILEPTVFLVGVRPGGGPPFLFQSSKPDNRAADEYARNYLARLNFHPAEPLSDEVRWGRVEFAWGNDIYR